MNDQIQCVSEYTEDNVFVALSSTYVIIHYTDGSFYGYIDGNGCAYIQPSIGGKFEPLIETNDIQKIMYGTEEVAITKNPWL